MFDGGGGYCRRKCLKLSHDRTYRQAFIEILLKLSPVRQRFSNGVTQESKTAIYSCVGVNSLS